MSQLDIFRLDDRVALIAGGGGAIVAEGDDGRAGPRHASALGAGGRHGGPLNADGTLRSTTNG